MPLLQFAYGIASRLQFECTQESVSFEQPGGLVQATCTHSYTVSNNQSDC